MLAQRLARLPRNLPAFLMLAFVLPLLAGCGYNTIPTAEENAKAAWSEVLNQYQRRADPTPTWSRP
jgi:LemA protein